MSLMLFTALSMLQASAAEPAAAQPVAPVAAPAKQKKICKVDDTDSYSRLRRRICLTQTEWDQKAAGATVNDLKNIGGR